MSPPNGRICWPQPIGDNHAGQALTTRRPLASTVPSMFPRPLTTNASPSTAAARPLAPRVVDESCTVTAATPANTIPKAPIASPAMNEPTAGSPVAIPTSPSSPASTRLAPTVTMSAAARPACRPDDGRADQLGASGLLVLAGVAHDGKGAHQRGQHREQQIAAGHEGGADARAGDDTEYPQGRRARKELDLLDESLVRVRPPHPHHSGHQDGRPEHVGGELEPVARQRQPGERDRAAQRIHRAPTSSALGSEVVMSSP